MIYLIRHASAGKRHADQADVERTLDETGRGQAEWIADALRGRSIDNILSSKATRCTQTVAPLATAIGVGIEITNELYEGGSPATVLAMSRRLAGAGSSAVLCTHGDIIPGVIDSLERSGVSVAGHGCAKGSIWELIVIDGLIKQAQYRTRS